MRLTIPINADLGEGAGNDARLMPFLTSCNIACGGHVGDKESMLITALLAKEYGVQIGAHPSYPDKDNFGRKIIEISPKELKTSIIEQIESLSRVCEQIGVSLSHIKLHGALYNLAAKDKSTALIFLDAIDTLPKRLPIYTLPDCELSRLAQKDFRVIHEAFLDRRYQADLNLTPRSQKDALLLNKEEIWSQAKNLYFKHKVKITTGEYLPLKAQTFCVHGDTPNIYESLGYISQQLKMT